MSICAVATILILTGFVSLQAKTRGIEAPITAVTVYPVQAMVTRTAEVRLEAGEQSLVIDNLPLAAATESFRASLSGGDGVTLLGLKHRTEEHLESPQARVAALEEQIRLLETGRKQSILDRIESFTEQKRLLTAIAEGSSKQMSEQITKGGLEVSQWGEAYKFIGKGVRETNDSIRLANRELHTVNQELEKLNGELKSAKGSGGKTTRTVQVDLRLSQPTTVTVSLDYTITGASWVPLYDARLIDDKHVDLTYLAEVAQETGEDWSDVDLTLSTSWPSLGTGPGEFAAWYLSLPERGSSDLSKVLVMNEYSAEGDFAADKEVFIRGGRAGEVRYMVDEAQMVHHDYGITFKIRRKETVLSGSEAVRTTISQYHLDAETKLICRPRNRQAVYRLATVTNQSEAPLMPGEVSIFADRDFIGSAELDEYIAPSEIFELSFGADKNFEVKREELAYKESETNGILNSKNRIEKTIRITLSNHSANAKTIDIEEAVPVSQNDRIKVKLDDPKPKPENIDEKGMATWSITLTPQGEQVIVLPYRIDYPQGEQIVGL